MTEIPEIGVGLYTLMSTVFVVSDRPEVLSSLTAALARGGFRAVVSTWSESEVEQQVAAFPPDVCLFDVEGTPVSVTEIRGHLQRWGGTRSIALLLLTTEERLADLTQSPMPDDFVLAPWHEGELVVRIRMLLWRMRKKDPCQQIAVGELVIDQDTYEVCVAGERLGLTYKEYQLLRFLAVHRGQVFTRETLLDQIWGYDYYGGVRTVDVHIRRIRAKLGEPAASLVETVRNVGYRFSADRKP